MPLHFAAARSTANSPIARALARKALARAANDNGDVADAVSFDTTMRAALRHFAEHGLNAAKEAARLAEDAHFSGDMQGYRWWLAICRRLDRKAADRLAHRLEVASALIY
ncbi:hypothetical protein P8Q88_03390 [Qipengyuania sp. XHP0207]|uniref:hypothetical protein n=1 Tax=Qipengyuania sp. XHP0207 TaxID=3038078 RepID=UPI00241D02DD|nr:hypothetical protein [Qipengyuania sp. XHP0207]MDG5747215.1 hypothetical protein [Qipengyuania sp. XHP0207]